MEQIQFKLEKYEGPLDLLLELIRKHKLNIHDIEISILLEQYIDYIANMHALNLEIATEFLIMAARLVYIKTISLLPKVEETEKLKRELQGQLLEYQWCKIVAGQMALMYRGSDVFVRKPVHIEFSKEDSFYKRFHNPRELIEAYMISLGRARRKLPPSKSSFSGIVAKKIVDVKVGKLNVLQKLIKDGRVLYVEFFHADEKSAQIATFLAMLDLLKGNRIVISEDGEYVEFNKNYKVEEAKSVSVEDLEKMFADDGEEEYTQNEQTYYNEEEIADSEEEYTQTEQTHYNEEVTDSEEEYTQTEQIHYNEEEVTDSEEENK